MSYSKYILYWWIFLVLGVFQHQGLANDTKTLTIYVVGFSQQGEFRENLARVMTHELEAEIEKLKCCDLLLREGLRMRDVRDSSGESTLFNVYDLSELESGDLIELGVDAILVGSITSDDQTETAQVTLRVLKVNNREVLSSNSISIPIAFLGFSLPRQKEISRLTQQVLPVIAKDTYQLEVTYDTYNWRIGSHFYPDENFPYAISPEAVDMIEERLPVGMEDRILNLKEVSEVAEKYGLIEVEGMNSHLSFTDRDLQYWHDRKLPSNHIHFQFLARNLVISLSNEEQFFIPDHGDLSYLSGRIFSNIYYMAEDYWGWDLPAFPWPPPEPSTFDRIPFSSIIGHEQNVTMKELTDMLILILDKAGYYDATFYGLPDGVVLVTRLESMQEDGYPSLEARRWIELPTGLFPFPKILEPWVEKESGLYRTIVFIISREDPSWNVEKPITSVEASDLVRFGRVYLTKDLEKIELKDDYRLTAYIYMFKHEKGENVLDPLPVGSSDVEVPARLQLERSVGIKHNAYR